MYAVIASGGKQYRVEEGQVIGLEKLPQEMGEKIDFDKVLMVADGENISIGAPFVDKAKVSAEVVSQERAKKIDIIKFKRRKHHMKHQGHRQYITKVKITGISAAGMSKAKATTAKPKAEAKPAEAAKPAKSKPKASASKEAAPAKEKKAEE